MEWTLPGTMLSVDADRPQAAEEVFSSLFLAGGLVLSQVTQVTGLEPYIIQNWVRRGFLAPPKQRKYTRRQLSRILMINALKSTLSIEQICKLLSYINGALDDEGDDTIDERLALFEKQRKNLEAQMAELQHTMDVLNFKCWFYETAKKAGTTLVPQCMEAEEIPEEFQKIREELHCKPECN